MHPTGQEDIGHHGFKLPLVGLFISLMFLATRNFLSPEQFDEWGWRVPFWVSIVMVGVSFYLRKNRMNLLFCQSKKAKEKTSTNH
jgi:MFS family permease